MENLSGLKTYPERELLAAKYEETNSAIVCIGAGEGQLPIITTAKDMGLRVIAVDRDKDSVGFRYADLCIIESTYNADSVIAALRNEGQSYAVKGVISRTTAAEALCTASAIADTYGLPGLSVELIKIATEKSRLREYCFHNNISFPCGVKTNISYISEDMVFPVIVKPDMTKLGKTSIQLCFDESGLAESIFNAMNNSASGYAEVETYIEGIDVSCLCFANKGHIRYMAWWDELVGIDYNKNIRGAGISIPSVIEGTTAQQEAATIGKRLMEGFHDVCALILLSFRITNSGKPYLIEVHADLGGDYIAEALLPAANKDFNFFKIAIDVASGKDIQSVPSFFKPTLVCYSSSYDAHSRDYDIIQKDAVEDNLLFIEDDLSGRFIIKPLHLKWLSNSGGLKYES
jgi:biotin carboxylase